MPNRTTVYIMRHKAMVGYLGSIAVLPKSSRNVILENFEFLNTSNVSAKLPTQLFAAPKQLNC